MRKAIKPVLEGLKEGDYVLFSGFFADRVDEGEHRSSVAQVGYTSLDKIQKYVYNFYGYRSQDFFGSPDLLCAGDSHTFGVGLPVDGTWPDMLSKGLDCSYVNLGVPGGSVESIVLDIFHYVRTYGAPKRIAIAFPELDRHLFYSDPDILVRENAKDYHGPANTQLSHLRDTASRPSISKKPHLIEDVIPVHHAIMSSIKMIHLLEDFCDARGISLYWCLWDNQEQINLIKDLKNQNSNYYRYFVDNLSDNWTRSRESRVSEYLINGVPVSCHLDLKDRYPNTFHFGTDKYPSHDGVHRHSHLSDIFKELIEQKDNI